MKNRRKSYSYYVSNKFIIQYNKYLKWSKIWFGYGEFVYIYIWMVLSSMRKKCGATAQYCSCWHRHCFLGSSKCSSCCPIRKVQKHVHLDRRTTYILVLSILHPDVWHINVVCLVHLQKRTRGARGIIR